MQVGNYKYNTDYTSPIPIHHLIILLILATNDILSPFLVFKIYFTVKWLVLELLEAKHNNTLEKLLKNMRSLDLLILNEW